MGDEPTLTEDAPASNNLTPAERKRLKKRRKEEHTLNKLEKEKEKQEKSKKQKLEDAVEKLQKELEPPRESTGRSYTVSIAVAGSVLDNAQSPPLRSYLAGQIARAAAIFNVDEIIIFDDTGGKAGTACEQMARILQFLECPQYLRKYLFGLHPDLKYAGVISPLDIPHHLRKDEVLPYRYAFKKAHLQGYEHNNGSKDLLVCFCHEFREGVVSNRPHKEGKGSYIYIGLEKDVRVDKVLPENTRVTVKLDNPDIVLAKKGKLRGTLVSPNLPRTQDGLYWGYSVRLASCLSEITSECPFRDGYDVIVGTSEKGTPVSELSFKKFKHMLVVFGGVEGLEYAFESDERTAVQDVKDLFHYYVNTCPSQGSRTIRTEEAILISLTAFGPIISKSQSS